MSEAQSGSAMLAGNPAGQPAAGSEAGGAPAASTPPAGDGGAPASPASGAWYDAIEDAELKGYVQNKGWKDPVELATGYKNLEKLLGSEKVPLPKGAEDKEGWARVYDALGRPKSAEEYKLPLPEGDNGEFAKQASAKFHELGISQQQAQSLAEWWNQTQQGQLEQMNQQQNQNVEKQLTDLKGEWGQAWDENVNLGQRAAREFGLNQEKLQALESAMGTGELLKFMAKIGRGLTEHTFEGGRSTSTFGMTPEAAKQRINDLRSDRAWAGKYMSGDAEAKAEMQRLMSLAYPQ
jgi:hypothetical protein